MRTLGFLIFVSAFVSSVALGQDCAGFPRIQGFESSLSQACLGLVAEQRDIPWLMPRQLLFKNSNVLWVSDLGTWEDPSQGAVYEINLSSLQFRQVYQGGYFTHGLGQDSQARLLIGDADRILRQQGQRFEVVLAGLPTEGSHPLTEFVVLPNNDLVVNIGAPSDNCSQQLQGGSFCPDRDDQGELRLYSYNQVSDSYSSDFLVLGKGLRNSMALLFNPVLQQVYQAENNMDAAGMPEEFNVIPLNASKPLDFGWPFCFAFHQQSPHLSVSFANFCNQRATPPAFLIPNHSAPLDMDYYSGTFFPELENTMVMGWHGHRRQVEAALVAYPVDKQKAPLIYSRSNNPFIEILSGINPSTGEKIRPVGVASDTLGRLWFVDDKTQRLYILARSNEPSLEATEETTGSPSANTQFVESLSVSAKKEFAEIYQQFMGVQTCTKCHDKGELPVSAEKALASFLNNKWLVLEQKPSAMPLFQRMGPKQTPRSMPPLPERPFAISQPQVYSALKAWVLKNF